MARKDSRPTEGKVVVMLDKPRALKYDFNAFCAVEDVTGLNLMAGQAVELRDPSARTLRALVWAGLIHEDPELTVGQVGAMLPMTQKGLGQVSDAIGRAMDVAMPDATEGDPTGGPEAA